MAGMIWEKSISNECLGIAHKLAQLNHGPEVMFD